MKIVSTDAAVVGSFSTHRSSAAATPRLLSMEKKISIMNESNSIVKYGTGVGISNMFDVLDDDADPPGNVETTSRRSSKGDKSKKPTSIPENNKEPIVLSRTVPKKNIKTINPDYLRYSMNFADYVEHRDKTRLHAERYLQSGRSRKPGEGEDQKKWENLVPLIIKREEAEIVVKIVELKANQRADRIKRLSNITYTIDSDYGRNIIGRAPCPRPKPELEAVPPRPPALKDARQFPALIHNSH